MTNLLILSDVCDKVVIEMKWGITVNDIQIKCFLAAAQSCSFSEAAEKVYMTPPTFGRYISSFETELGYPLFLRGWKNLRLTAAGEMMYEGIQEIQKQFEQLQTEAKRLNAGEVGQLMIGMLEGQIMDDRLRNILRYFRQQFPELQLRLHRCTFRQLEYQLLNGELDLGITLQMEVEDNEDLCYRPYQSLKNYIILPKEHPLAEKTDLSLNDFAGDAFLELEEGECHHISQMMNACCQQAGFAPKLFVCPDLSAQLFALETGLGVMMLNENHTALQNPHLVARSLEGLPTAEFCIAWHGANPNPAVQLFLQQL